MPCMVYVTTPGGMAERRCGQQGQTKFEIGFKRDYSAGMRMQQRTSSILRLFYKLYPQIPFLPL